MAYQDRVKNLLDELGTYCTDGDFTTNGGGLFSLPLSMIVGGPTGVGKTRFVKDLLDDLRQGEGYTLNVTLFYGTDQALFDRMGIDKKYQGLNDFVSVVKNLQRLDTKDDLPPGSKERVHNVLIVDDLMTEVVKKREVADVITRGISHQGLSIILIYQNLLPQDKYARTIAMNVHYKVCFYNYQTAGQFKAVVAQMESGKETLIEMYRALVHEKGPLVIDCLKHLAWYGLEPDCVVDLRDKP